MRRLKAEKLTDLIEEALRQTTASSRLCDPSDTYIVAAAERAMFVPSTPALGKPGRCPWREVILAKL